MFEWKLLQVCGYGFNLSQDKSGDNIKPDLFYICNPGEIPEIIIDKNRFSSQIFLNEARNTNGLNLKRANVI